MQQIYCKIHEMEQSSPRFREEECETGRSVEEVRIKTCDNSWQCVLRYLLAVLIKCDVLMHVVLKHNV